ncbi:hypothetical protein AKO1_012434 [Acrasis kona]|uniref:Beta-lactamase-related domain-containing protein n=1 Tax=Acrasis kona TaxID=1008807 RepID=A0AAW2YXH3_9EUKA
MSTFFTKQSKKNSNPSTFQNTNSFVKIIKATDGVAFTRDYSPSRASSSSSHPIGSLTYIFTAIAITQLLEKGSIQLTDRVGYILSKYGAPFELDTLVIGGYDSWTGTPKVEDVNRTTIAHLLSRTSGYDGKTLGIGSLAKNPATTINSSLADVVKNNLPPKVRFAGEATVDSDFTFTLLAYVVELVSGQSFESYLTNNIFAPLKLSNTFYQKPFGEADTFNGISYIQSLGGSNLWSSADDLSTLATTLLVNSTNLFVYNNTIESFYEVMHTDANHEEEFNVPITSTSRSWWLTKRGGVRYAWRTSSIGTRTSTFSLFPDHNVALISLGTSQGVLSSSLCDSINSFVDVVLSSVSSCESLVPRYNVPYVNVSNECVQNVPQEEIVTYTDRSAVGCYAYAGFEHTSWFKLKSFWLPSNTICLSISNSNYRAMHHSYDSQNSLTYTEFDLIQFKNQKSSQLYYVSPGLKDRYYTVENRPKTVVFNKKYLVYDGFLVLERQAEPIFVFVICFFVILGFFTLAPLLFAVFVCYEVCVDFRRVNANKSSDFLLNQGRKEDRYELLDAGKSLIKEDNLTMSAEKDDDFVWNNKRNFYRRSIIGRGSITDQQFDVDFNSSALTPKQTTVTKIKTLSKKLLCTVLFTTAFSTFVMAITSSASLVHLSAMVINVTIYAKRLDAPGLNVDVFLYFPIGIVCLNFMCLLCWFVMLAVRIKKPSVGGWIYVILYFIAMAFNLVYIPLCVYLNWFKQIPGSSGIK